MGMGTTDERISTDKMDCNDKLQFMDPTPKLSSTTAAAATMRLCLSPARSGRPLSATSL